MGNLIKRVLKVTTKKENLGTATCAMYSSNAKEVTQEEFSSSKWKVLRQGEWIEDTTLTCHLNYGKVFNPN